MLRTDRAGSSQLDFISSIFEWAESKSDLAECLYGGTFSTTGLPTSEAEICTSTTSFSTTYASHLITLAQARNFDGYLVNIETDLNFLPPASSYPCKLQDQRKDAASLEREKSLAGLGALISSEVQQKRDYRMKKNASALLGWVGWLREEGKRRVGPHWQIIWSVSRTACPDSLKSKLKSFPTPRYDSVTTAGQLQWQDALSPANAPFFLNSDAILTNYTWARPPDPAPPGGLRELTCHRFEHHPALVSSADMAHSLGRSPGDVYIGIDVFGRNCYGGFDVGRSLNMIFPSRNTQPVGSSETSGFESSTDGEPNGLGLSVALFAPGWTWEREYEGGGERRWSEWWADELRFWAGGRAVASDLDLGSPAGTVTPIGSFFGPRERSFLYSSPILPNSQSAPSIDPVENPAPRHDGLSSLTPVHQKGVTPPTFYTNFNRGSGRCWWVQGHKVYEASSPAEDSTEKHGWTDMGSCFPKPDRIWPRPVVVRFADGDQVGLTSSNGNGTERWTAVGAALTDCEAWEGGTSLEIFLRLQPNVGSDPAAKLPSIPTFSVLPLCTLNACHFALHQSRFYSLEMVVKPFLSPTMVQSFSELQVQPCFLWASCKPSEGVSYRFPQSQHGQTQIHELDNGWYSITVLVQLDQAAVHLPPEMQARGAIAVLAVGIGWSGTYSLHTSGLRLLVGEISFSALPQPPSSDPSLGQNVAAPHPWPSSNLGIVHWDPAPRPNGVCPTSLWGILTWELQNRGEGEEDNGGIGVRSEDVMSGYFNVFATLGKQRGEVVDHGAGNSNSVWLGTSTYGPNPNSFTVAGLEPLDLVSKVGNASDRMDISLSCSKDMLTEGKPSINMSSPQDKVTFGVQRVGAGGRLTSQVGEAMIYICEVEIAPEK